MTKKFVDYSLYQKLHVFLGEETVELQNVHQNVTSFFQNRVLSKVLLLQASCISLFKLHDCFNLKTLKSFDPFLKTETGTMAFEKRGRFILFPTYQSFDPFFSDWPSWLHQLVLLLMTYFSFVSFLARWDFSFLDCSRGGKARRKVHFQKINQANEKLSKEACHFLIHQS